MAVYVTDEEQEKVILVGVELDPSDDSDSGKDDSATRQLSSGYLYRKRKA